MSPSSHADRHDDWPVKGYEESDVAYVGQSEATEPDLTVGGLHGGIYYDPSTERLFTAEPDADAGEMVPVSDAELELDPEETLGEALERVGDEVGWDSLSEFARDHLEDDG